MPRSCWKTEYNCRSLILPAYTITFAHMQNLTVKIVNRSSNELPAYATAGAAGMDLRASIPAAITLNSLERKLVPTGLFIELPHGYEAQVRPRSGLAIKQGITCLNSPGTIDCDYRGEVMVILVNLGREEQVIQPGDRIAQMVISPVQQAQLILVQQLNDTQRGEGGFGHTGNS